MSGCLTQSPTGGPLGGDRRLDADHRAGPQPLIRRLQDVLVAPLGHGGHAQRRRCYVVPSGMFQPFIPGESADLLEQFSVAATAIREFVEELYGVHELETGDGRVDPNAIYRRREAQLLDGMLKAGDAALLYSGVAVNLLALRHEICTVLVIEDPAGTSARAVSCGSVRSSSSNASRPSCYQINVGSAHADAIRPGGAGVVGPLAREHHRGPGCGRRRAWPPGRSRSHLLTFS